MLLRFDGIIAKHRVKDLRQKIELPNSIVFWINITIFRGLLFYAATILCGWIKELPKAIIYQGVSNISF
jgi:hypothetical protein